MFLLGIEEREKERRKYKLFCLIRSKNCLEELQRKNMGIIQQLLENGLIMNYQKSFNLLMKQRICSCHYVWGKEIFNWWALLAICKVAFLSPITKAWNKQIKAPEKKKKENLTCNKIFHGMIFHSCPKPAVIFKSMLLPSKLIIN